MSDKRKDYISWDEYFMGVAKLSALRSKDPNTQVGACIVSSDNKILSMGYNGLPRGCSDDEFPWCREGDPLDNKYFYTTHSELNAILNYRGGTLDGAKMYVTLFPCNEMEVLSATKVSILLRPNLACFQAPVKKPPPKKTITGIASTI